MTTEVNAVIGPPGTGKTTTIADKVTADAAAGRKPMVCSLTTNAAQEIASRGLTEQNVAVGTLHSLAYSTIEHRDLAETRTADWNRAHSGYLLSGGKRDPDDPYAGRSERTLGDRLYETYTLNRARCVPREAWRTEITAFAARYEDWKKAESLIDFTDMIELAQDHPPPGCPDVIYADEAQDHSRLELNLLKRWARWAGALTVVGDPYQALYEWRGAYPEMFDRVPGDRTTVLGQSYRVPRAVHATATAWIKGLSTYRPITYAPRDEQGSVNRLAAHYRDPHPVVNRIEGWLAVNPTDTVMVCASCDYMIWPTLKLLRSRGIPYANPWRRKRGDWNPLTSRGVTTGSRVLSYLRPIPDAQEGTVNGAHGVLTPNLGNQAQNRPASNSDAYSDSCDDFNFGYNVREIPQWTVGDMHAWTELILAKGVLTTGSKTLLKSLATGDDAVPRRVVRITDLRRWFLPDAATFLERMHDHGVTLADALAWLPDKVMTAKRRTFDYAVNVIQKRGRDDLKKPPRVYVGTIHSFKGSQATRVVIYPDLSPQGMAQWNHSGRPRDEVIRQFYVALTRAREELWLCQPASSMTSDVWRTST